MKLLHLSLILSLSIAPLYAAETGKKSALKKPGIISRTLKKVRFGPDVVDNEPIKDSSMSIQQPSVPKECVKGISWGISALILAYISTGLGCSTFDIWSYSSHRFTSVRNPYLIGGLVRTGGCIAFSAATAYAVYQSIQAFKKISKKQLGKNS